MKKLLSRLLTILASVRFWKARTKTDGGASFPEDEAEAMSVEHHNGLIEGNWR